MRCSKCGTNAETGNRFCTNCGNVLDNDDAVVRIIDNDDVVHSNGGLQSKPKFRVSAVPLRRKISKKKLIGFASSALAVVLIFLTINFFRSINKKEYKYNGEFVLMVKEEDGKRDLYLGEPGRKEVKIASDVEETSYYRYIGNGSSSRKYIYLGQDGSLYETDGKGNAEKISSRASNSYFSVSGDLKKYLFIAGEDTLYLKEQGKTKVKLVSNVQNYFFLEDNETILFNTKAGELFIRKKKGDIEKLAEDVRYEIPSPTSDGIVYVKSDESSHYINLNSGEEREITDSPGSGIIGFDEKGNIIYKKDNDLYYLEEGKEPMVVASDVTNEWYLGEVIIYPDSKGKWHFVKIGSSKVYDLPDLQEPYTALYRDGYIFYIDKYGTFSRVKQGASVSEKIQDDVNNVYAVEKDLYFIAHEDSQILYRVEKDGSKTKIQEEVTAVQTVDNAYMAYMTEDCDLYIDGKKYSDVKNFTVGGKNICYVNTDDELYLVEGKGTPKKICDDVTEYSELYFGGGFLFRFTTFTDK